MAAAPAAAGGIVTRSAAATLVVRGVVVGEPASQLHEWAFTESYAREWRCLAALSAARS